MEYEDLNTEFVVSSRVYSGANMSETHMAALQTEVFSEDGNSIEVRI